MTLEPSKQQHMAWIKWKQVAITVLVVGTVGITGIRVVQAYGANQLPPGPVETVTVTVTAAQTPDPVPVQMTTPAPATTLPFATSDPEPYYRSCADARAAGVAPLYRGDPGYRSALDGDGDGIACES